MDLVQIASRWLHVVAACLVIGGVFFMRVLLPMGLRTMGADAMRSEMYLRARRGFKMMTHSCIFVLLVTGTYNMILAFKGINANPNLIGSKALFHGLIGVHLILAILVIVLAIVALKPKEPKANAKGLMTVNLVLLFLIVATTSATKATRDRLNAEGARVASDAAK